MKTEEAKFTLADAERGCALYDATCTEMETIIADLEKELGEVKHKYMAALKRKVGQVARCEAELTQIIEASPELFAKPKTMILHGVKIGFTLSKGSVEFDDDDEQNVVRRIQALCGCTDEFKTDDTFVGRESEFIRTKFAVNKVAVSRLSAEDLERIGCRIDGAGDVVCVKRVAGDVEKIIDKMIAKLVETMVENSEAA